MILRDDAQDHLVALFRPLAAAPADEVVDEAVPVRALRITFEELLCFLKGHRRDDIVVRSLIRGLAAGGENHAEAENGGEEKTDPADPIGEAGSVFHECQHAFRFRDSFRTREENSGMRPGVVIIGTISPKLNLIAAGPVCQRTGPRLPLEESALNKAIRLDDALVEPHFYLGAIRYQKADHRGAIPELSRSMDLLPTKEAAGMLSKSYEAIGDKENGRKYAEMAQ